MYLYILCHHSLLCYCSMLVLRHWSVRHTLHVGLYTTPPILVCMPHTLYWSVRHTLHVGLYTTSPLLVCMPHPLYWSVRHTLHTGLYATPSILVCSPHPPYWSVHHALHTGLFTTPSKVASMCQREIKRNAMRSWKLTKDSQSRAKRMVREVGNSEWAG